MILHKESDNGVTIVFYDSTNILESIYIENRNLLYIVFHKGGAYSYTDVPKEVYDEFEASPSQGIYFAQKIKKVYNYKKDFILKEWELKSVKSRIDELKKDNNEKGVI